MSVTKKENKVSGSQDLKAEIEAINNKMQELKDEHIRLVFERSKMRIKLKSTLDFSKTYTCDGYPVSLVNDTTISKEFVRVLSKDTNVSSLAYPETLG